MSSHFAAIKNPSLYTLGTLRQFPQLSLAWVETTLWVSGLDVALINDALIKTIPGIQCYFQLAGTLYTLRSQLPWGTVPALDWQPVSTAIPIVQPAFNHHFFDINEKIPVALVPSIQEQEATAMLVSCRELGEYVHTAPAIRLAGLMWAVVGDTEAIVIGSPLLPINATAYWRRGQILLPLGFDWEYPNLAVSIEDAINPAADTWLLLQTDGSCMAIPFHTLVPLSRASVRHTLSGKHSSTL